MNPTLPCEDLFCVDPFEHVLLPEIWSDTAAKLISHLDRSVMLRVRDIPITPEEQGKARVAVLFSGGIDSTVLAFLADRWVQWQQVGFVLIHELVSHLPANEPIDLLNVAFENPRKIQGRLDCNLGARPKRERQRQQKVANMNVIDKGSTSYLVPDRVTGLQEVEELRRLCPKRMWNFVCLSIVVFITLAEMTKVEIDVSYEVSSNFKQTC